MTDFYQDPGNSLCFSHCVCVGGTRGHTGRNITENDDLAMEWAESRTRDEILKHKALKVFRKALDQVQMMRKSIDAYRGQGIKGSESINVDRMGPPPSEKCREGRYNLTGKPALYLACCENGVQREQEHWNVDGTPYIQRYQLPASLKIGDFRECQDPFLTTVFTVAENCNVAERAGHASYTYSQTIAEIVAGRFEGMLLPGCRGSHENWYCNVVIFYPYHSEWKRWCNRGPYKPDWNPAG